MIGHSARTLTDAIIAALDVAGITVGDGEKPAGGGWDDVARLSDHGGYVLLYPLVGGTTAGPISDLAADATVLYQLTAVGASRQQAEWIADQARVVMLSKAFAPAGRVVTLVVIDMLGGATRDDAGKTPLWFSPDRYSVTTVPA